MFTPQDLQYLAARGTSSEKAEEQLATIRRGFPRLRLEAAASAGNGILVPTPEEEKAACKTWDKYLADGHRVIKFVPASGAASRMFKNLYAFLDGESDVPSNDFERLFFSHIHYFAFFDELDACCSRLYGKGIDVLLKENGHKAIVHALLDVNGLGYGHLPKGLLLFHRNPDGGARTPVDEHVAEGAMYAADVDNRVHIHFTVSPEHREFFRQQAEKASAMGEKKYGVTCDITFSEQKSSTDTIAANPDGTPFHDAAGNLVFRPGGHGALIENLSDLKADVVFIKNIDNVVPDSQKDATVDSKRLLAGLLVTHQQKVFSMLRLLDSGEATDSDLADMLTYLEQQFCVVSPWFHPSTVATDSRPALIDYLRRKLCRPMRVCGMVRNIGEPGGGPFIAYNADGTRSLQILESSQIDLNDPASAAMFEHGTHFNPVDLVCAICDYNGKPFNLRQFVDPATGFISSKSKDSRELLALELPGLWNGAMSDWLTLFVEVPLATFNPVKTVNDLLREPHQ